MKTALQFSGGKDSLATLFYMRSLWPYLTVVNVDTAMPDCMTCPVMECGGTRTKDLWKEAA